MYSVKDKSHGVQMIIFCTTNGRIIDIIGVYAGFNQETKILNSLSNEKFHDYKNKKKYLKHLTQHKLVKTKIFFVFTKNKKT